MDGEEFQMSKVKMAFQKVSQALRILFKGEKEEPEPEWFIKKDKSLKTIKHCPICKRDTMHIIEGYEESKWICSVCYGID